MLICNKQGERERRNLNKSAKVAFDLSNDPGKVESNFFCGNVLSPHRNVLSFYTENA